MGESKQKPLLYLQNVGAMSSEPLIDDYTLTMLYAFDNYVDAGTWCNDKFIRGMHKMGVYTCDCGATSTCMDYLLTGEEFVTNALCVHYLAFHRDRVSAEELNAIKGFQFIRKKSKTFQKNGARLEKMIYPSTRH